MYKRKNYDKETEPRMLTIDQACAYTGRGRTSCREWCNEIGATRHYGAKMVRYDKSVIDAALDGMTETKEGII